jgi:pimeloyl-ACP methyl ester carboxylesterase
MPYIETAGDRLYFTTSQADYQAGYSIVCVHGSGGSLSHWPKKLRRLDKFSIVALDLPGHGKSQGKGRDSIEEYVTVVDAFVRATNLHRVIMMGHSLGGAIAQQLALSEPRWLAALILVGTGARLRVAPSILDALLKTTAPAANLIADWSFGPSAPTSAVETVRNGWQHTPRSITYGDFKACDGFDVMQKIKNILIPVLVLTGSEDKLTPPKYGSYLASNIPDAKHIMIPNAGHMMALEYPDIFIEQVMTFADQISNPP